jgi:hypothetical protein
MDVLRAPDVSGALFDSSDVGEYYTGYEPVCAIRSRTLCSDFLVPSSITEDRTFDQSATQAPDPNDEKFALPSFETYSQTLPRSNF